MADRKQEHKIPQNIWETDCRYCHFRVSEENYAENEGKTKYDFPCKIGCYKGHSWIYVDGEKKTEHEVYTEHCNHVRPNECFGICQTCRWQDIFGEENEFCERPSGPENRRNTMPWVRTGCKGRVTSWDYSYFTCDRYMVRDTHEKEFLVKRALEGRIPMNFNPDTMQALEYMDGEPIDEWKARQDVDITDKG